MKKLILLFFLLLGRFATSAQSSVSSAYIQTFKALKLEQKYQLTGFIKPAFQMADFNGDGKPDVAALVIEKVTKKKGLILIHGGFKQYFVFGAGMDFAGSGDNYNWLNGWRIYRKKIVYETLIDKDGNITGSKAVKIRYPSIEIYNIEDGDIVAGCVIYWDGKKYSLVHIGE